jgi:hypothetical protein
MLKWFKHFLNWHICYFGVPHRVRGALIQTCYECGKYKVVRWDLRENV